MSVIIFLLFRLKLKQRYALNNEHYTALKIRGHKHLCKDCGSIFVDRFNTLDLCSKMTNRLRCKIQQLSLTKPFKHIARDGKGYSFEILIGKVLYGQAYKTKAIFSYNKIFSDSTLCNWFFNPLVIKYDPKSYGFVQTDIRSRY